MSRRGRRARSDEVAGLDPARDLYALRDALADADATVRATALGRLDEGAARRLVAHVRDATEDASSTVREHAFVALARARDPRSLLRAREAIQSDRGFRVRRAAIVYAARTFGAEAAGLLAIACADPFWRVRVVARRAGAALDVAVDLTDPDRAAREVDPLVPTTDPDPAVVTARLVRLGGRVAPPDLVPMLASPHASLRRLAVVQLGLRGDEGALLEVTRWLVDERIPYAASAAEAALRRAGARAAVVASLLLGRARTEPAGPLAWALRAPCSIAWRDLEPLLTHPDPRVRRAAITRIPEAAPDLAMLYEAMSRSLRDEDAPARCRAVAWLARVASQDAKQLLLSIEQPSSQPTFVRAVLVDVFVDVGDTEGLRRFAEDEHGGIRARAIEALARRNAISETERRAIEADEDPRIRRAGLTVARAAAALGDASPIVRESAVTLLSPDERSMWSTRSVDDPSPVVRMRGVGALAEVRGVASTVALLRLSRDADPGVRSAAVHVLEDRTEHVAELLRGGALEVEGRGGASARIAALTLLRLGGQLDPDAQADPRDAEHLALLDAVLAGRAPRGASDDVRPPPRALHEAARTLGRTGLRVHPLGLSGAHGLPWLDFALAHDRGVDLFFWEPSYRELARFLRVRRDAVVVAGTYEAHAKAIERDVVGALRALRREALDVFLAFWARSPARLDETRDVLGRLVTRGLVRAIGVSTHDRGLAVDASARGFDVVMVRHSAAHRGVEDAVLPACAAHGTGVLTFSNLCYGRMLHRTAAPVTSAVTAPDCYRYSLSRPGVHACIAAPRRHAELIENLSVIDELALTEARAAELRAHGDEVYARSRAWGREGWSVAEGRGGGPRSDERDASIPEDLDDWVRAPHSLSGDV